MQSIDKLITFRKKHGYYQNDFSRYLKAAKSHIKLDPIYKSEYYLARFNTNKGQKKTGNKYIKKALKFSESTGIDDYIYFIKAIYCKNHEMNREAIDNLLKIHSNGNENTIFINEVNSIISSIDESAIPPKICYNWNGINLSFNTEKEKKDFLQNKMKIEIFDYQSEVINYIIKYNKEKESLLKSIKSSSFNLKKIINKCENLFELLSKFEYFLSNNFQENYFIKQTKIEVDKITEFYKAILRYKMCDLDAEKIIDEYKVPSCFEEVRDDIQNARNNKVISIYHAKKVVAEHVDKIYDVKESKINMPFPPIFYDTAFDYIQYPKEKPKKLGGLLKHFSIFNKK